METVKDFRTVEAFVTNLGKYNEGELIGEWVTFPIDEEEEEALMKRIGVSDEPNEEGIVYDEYFVTDYENYGIDLYDLFGEYPNIQTLNDLAEELSNVSVYDEDKLLALINENYYGSGVDGVAEAIENLDDWYFIESWADWAEELHGYEVPDWLSNYVDWEAFGDDISYDMEYIETANGYYYKS